MQLNITARHINLTHALSDYVHRKVEKAQRFFDSIIWAQAILSVEKHRHMAELVVHTPGNTFRTKGEAGDLYSAIDLAVHKLDVLLSRTKEKKRDHRDHRKAKHLAGIPGNGSDFSGPIEGAKPMGAITEVNRITLQSPSLPQAIEEMNSGATPFMLFLNEETNEINLIYKKGKKRYGLLQAK